MAFISNPEALCGKYVTLREVCEEDADFILNLRLDPKKASCFVRPIENNLQKQVDYIRRYKSLKDEWYFLIENKKGEKLGVISIYDLKPDSFGSGRWLMSDNASPQEVIEGELLMKNYGFNVLGYPQMHFDVLKGNRKVLNFHRLWNSTPVYENEQEIFFILTKENFEKNRIKIEGML